jgi:four helix bundle protein
VTRFEDLFAWQKARQLVGAIYVASNASSFARDFALRDQIRRAAISIPSDIAEGFERNGLAEFHHFLSIAKASCAEVRTQLYIALDIGHLDERAHSRLHSQACEVARIVGGLRRSVEEQLKRRSSKLSTQDSALRTASRC